MKSIRIILFFITLTLTTHIVAQGGKDYGQFAPDDAFAYDSIYAYYGSENEWSRRMFSERAATRFYKRRGQRQLLAILDGHPREAKKICQNRLKDDPNDLESLFNLTIAFTQLNQPDQAFETMKRAVEAGLPFERFLAGPRGLLKPLTETGAFQEFASRYPKRLIHGPLLGAVTDKSARFWVRTAKEASVIVRVFQNENTEMPVQSSPVQTRAENDYTGVAEVSGLQPDTRYLYNLVINGASVFSDGLPFFRTYPAAGEPSRFQIAFGGCAGYTPQYEPIWDMIAAYQPLAFLFLGDNVYIDLPELPGAFHDYTYYRRQSRPEFRRLVQSTSVYAIWDDHDSVIDDVWMGPFIDKPHWKQPLFEHFLRNWNNPKTGSKDWPGGWFRFSIADVDFLMLDGRMYRTNPFRENPTMLGPEQKKWLFRELKQSKAVFKIIASPVSWALDAKPNSKDTWNGFKEERQEIFDFLAKNKIDGVILLSSDRHRLEIWKNDRQKAYPLYEFLSGRLTNIHTHEPVPGTLFSYNEKCAFGLITFDTRKDDPEITYEIINIDNEKIHSFTLKRSQISN